MIWGNQADIIIGSKENLKLHKQLIKFNLRECWGELEMEMKLDFPQREVKIITGLDRVYIAINYLQFTELQISSKKMNRARIWLPRRVC